MFKLAQRVLDLIFVPRCAVCKSRLRYSTVGLCEECYERYEDAKTKYCDFCGMEARICTCVPYFMLINGCTDYRKLAFYTSSGDRNVVRRMVYSIKRWHNLPLTNYIACELAEIDGRDTEEEIIVTYVPRSLENLRKYGYDHSKIVAKYYAEYRSLKMLPLLRRKVFHRSSEQKLLNYSQRAANTKGAFVVRPRIDICGKTVILIDDVVTSGATIGECAAMLYSAGAKNVICRSFAHTYRKNKSKKD